MEEQKPRYTLIVKNKRIPVNKEVYRAYYKHKEREKYLDKLAREKNVSLDAYNQYGIQVECLCNYLQESIEDKLIKAEILTALIKGIETLDENEKWLIQALYSEGKSEHQIAREIGITQQAVHKRKAKILAKLKKFIEI